METSVSFILRIRSATWLRLIFHLGGTVLFFLRKTNIQKGHKSMIYGVSSTAGSLAAQFSKYYGAVVTGICSTKYIDLIKWLGADKIIDYIKKVFLADNNLYDIIFEAVERISYNRIKPLRKKEGKYISVVTY